MLHEFLWTRIMIKRELNNAILIYLFTFSSVWINEANIKTFKFSLVIFEDLYEFCLWVY